MVLHVVAVGRIKNQGLRHACDEYVARARHYLRLEIHEVREAGYADRRAEDARRSEGEALMSTIPRGAHVVAVTRQGKGESSRSLASCIERWHRDHRDVVLVIGGAHGLDRRVLERADTQLSLSSMTFPHELARLILLEQLYRACSILRGEPYHKGG